MTIENSLELGLRADTERHPDCTELESRVANSEGLGAVTMEQLVRRSLRMNPDRVIVGEVLGPEIILMLQAMSQGNDGSLSTLHARSGREVFERIATYGLLSPQRLPTRSRVLPDRRRPGLRGVPDPGPRHPATPRQPDPGGQRVRPHRRGRLLRAATRPSADGTAQRTSVVVSEARYERLLAAGWQTDAEASPGGRHEPPCAAVALGSGLAASLVLLVAASCGVATVRHAARGLHARGRPCEAAGTATACLAALARRRRRSRC